MPAAMFPLVSTANFPSLLSPTSPPKPMGNVTWLESLIKKE